MIVTLLPFSVKVEAAYENYGEDAYNYLKYIDENLRERIAGTDREQLAAEYFFEQFESFGYTPEYQEFSYIPEWYEIDYTEEGETCTSKNVIVTKQGKTEKTIIVGSVELWLWISLLLVVGICVLIIVLANRKRKKSNK